jgi:hypothetical protein
MLLQDIISTVVPRAGHQNSRSLSDS